MALKPTVPAARRGRPVARAATTHISLPLTVFVAALLLTFFPVPGSGQVQYPDSYSDHTPFPFNPDSTVADSCHWIRPKAPPWPPYEGIDSCDCGSIYPKGPDYKYSRMGGNNYDPDYDSCLLVEPPCVTPPQVDHIFRVPCDYTQDPNYSPPQGDFDVEVGCFTLAFDLTQCQEGKVVDGIEIKLRDQEGPCRNSETWLTKPKDTVTVYDTVIVGNDTTVTPRDSVGRDTVGVFSTGTGGSTMIYEFDTDTNVVKGGPLPPRPPCKSRSFKFDICNLWKWGHGPAELECPTVFEIVLRNSDGTYCGIIPFVIWGSCVFPADPKAGGGGDGEQTRSGLYIPDVGELEMRLIRYEGGQGIELE